MTGERVGIDDLKFAVCPLLPTSVGFLDAKRFIALTKVQVVSKILLTIGDDKDARVLGSKGRVRLVR